MIGLSEPSSGCNAVQKQPPRTLFAPTPLVSVGRRIPGVLRRYRSTEPLETAIGAVDDRIERAEFRLHRRPEVAARLGLAADLARGVAGEEAADRSGPGRDGRRRVVVTGR